MKGFIFLLKSCWKFEKKYIIFAIIFQFFYILTPLSNIIIPKFIIDELLGDKDIFRLFLLIFLLLSFSLLGGLGKTYFQGKMFTSKNLVFNKFQCMIAEKMSTCDYEQLENPQFLDTKEQASKFLYADGRGFGMVLDDLFNILGQMLVFIGISAIIFQLNPWLLLIFISLTGVNALVESKVKKQYVEWDMEKAPIERKTGYMLNLVQDFRYGKEIRIYELTDWLKCKTTSQLTLSQEFYKKQVNVLNKSIYTSVGLTFIREILAYLYVVMQVFHNRIGVGSFTMYISAITQFSQSMDSVMKSFVSIKHFNKYSNALMNYMNLPSTNSEKGNEDLPKEPYSIEFKHVWFKYPGQEKYVLEDINVIVRANEKIAVIGENGSGKTTFVKLLLRLYLPTKGEILINNKNYLDISFKEYLKLFSVVFQDYNLFSFTLKENVVFENKNNKSDKEIEELTLKCGFDVNKKLKNGIYEYINRDFEDTGVVLSGGEGQKVALGRAMYKDTPIVILDEPTAALDPKAEYELYLLFAEAMNKKTAIFISHRLASCHFCEKILVFQQGKIVEQGSHDELLAEQGLYAQTYKLQASLY